VGRLDADAEDPRNAANPDTPLLAVFRSLALKIESVVYPTLSCRKKFDTAGCG
jgi:hypothetical protein